MLLYGLALKEQRFSSFPPNSTSRSSIQLSGSALAGPMLQEGASVENPPPALLLAGEMTGKGLDAGRRACLRPQMAARHGIFMYFHAFSSHFQGISPSNSRWIRHVKVSFTMSAVESDLPQLELMGAKNWSLVESRWLFDPFDNVFRSFEVALYWPLTPCYRVFMRF